MATVTDTLETLIQVRGTSELIASLGAASGGFGALSVAEGVTTAATDSLATAMGLLETVMAPVLGMLGLAAGAVGVFAESFHAFSGSESSLARVALQLKNLPGAIPIGELTEFSDKMERLTGISHNVINTLGATASQFGETKSQLEKLIPTVLDIAQAKDIDPDSVLNKLLRAGNRPQGLLALGINPAKLTGDLHDVNNLVEQLGKGFGGVAEGFRNTLPGSFHALQTSAEGLAESMGRLFSPALLPVINTLAHSMDGWAIAFNRVAGALHIPTAAALGTGGGRGSSDFSVRGDPEQTAALKGIEKNTQRLEDTFVKNVLGGPGTAARAAFTARDARLAFGI